ncbi:MAG: DUF6067 family protein [Planctomycetota bacterium]|nr:DUF6067 family protein [Planctomycetota bacterium]
MRRFRTNLLHSSKHRRTAKSRRHSARRLRFESLESRELLAVNVWANDGGDKVTQDELRVSQNPSAVINSVWDGDSIDLFAARNEVVSFNLVLEASAEAATNVDVAISSLVGPGGAMISSTPATGDELFDYIDRNVELFFVRYLEIEGLTRDLAFAPYYSNFDWSDYDERVLPERIQRPHTDGRSPLDEDGNSLYGWTARPDANKFYPDIAVPLELEQGFTIDADTNQSIWGDIYVPKDTPPGVYQGTITVTEGGVLSEEIPISLDVKGFTLPDTPTTKTMLYYSSENVNLRHTGQEWIDTDDTRMTSIQERYHQMAHRHKISLIEGPPIDYPSFDTHIEAIDEAMNDFGWTDVLSGELFTPARGYAGPGVGTGNNVFSISTYGGWQWSWDDNDNGTLSRREMERHADAWVNWFDQQGFETPVDYFLYLIDESDDYPQTERWARWLDENPGSGSRLNSMATIDLTAAATETRSLDVVASWFNEGDEQAWQTLADQYLSDNGKQFMLYNSSRPASGTFATEDDGVALRELAWGQFKKEIDRWFYWESTYYENFQGYTGDTNVFQQAKTFGNNGGFDFELGQTGNNYYNGDGVLFYPGTDTVFPEESYGVDGPIASLRLKHWRRGIQDADYLAMALAIDPARTQAIIDRVVPRALWENGFQPASISWSADPDVWETARAELAEIIAGDFEPPPPPPSDDVVAFRPVVVDVNGVAVSSVTIGDSFELQVYAQDIRNEAEGVFAAYVDVSYDVRRAAVDGPIAFGAMYPNARDGVLRDGLVDEAGAIADATLLAGESILLFSIPFHATGAGLIVFATDPADDVPFHSVLLYGSDTAVSEDRISYGSVTVQITASLNATDESLPLCKTRRTVR